MIKKLQEAWFSEQKWIYLLAPLTCLFAVLSAFRRALFRLNIKSSYQSTLAVIVVGNIGIGGNGKTPLVLALVKRLKEQGYRPAVLSRGYGGMQRDFPYLLLANDAASLVGDEPALINNRVVCPVIIDPIRARGAKFIENNTQANIIICDDGLQHYALERDIELCVVDKRGLGNGFLLPMGPLREGKWRLNTVDLVVNNLGFLNESNDTCVFDEQSSSFGEQFKANVKGLKEGINAYMSLHHVAWVNLVDNIELDTKDFNHYLSTRKSNKISVHAMAGIGEPERFFKTLDKLAVTCSSTQAYPDHYVYKASDIPKDAVVLMTEKDAVKCLHLSHENCWYLKISARLSQDFEAVFKKLESTNR